MPRWKRTRGGRFEWGDACSDLLVVGEVGSLHADERADVPDAIVAVQQRWLAARETRFDRGLPEELSFLRDSLRVCEPMLARTTCEAERVYWHVRIVPHGARWLRDRGPALLEQCPAADGVPRCEDPAALPPPLGWLATMFGTTSAGPETSCTSPWGRPLGSFIDAGDALVSDPETAALLPPGSREWVALYEADGDVLVADLAGGRAHWAGFEWTGDVSTDLHLPWRAVVPFLVWSHFAGRSVRPSDLAMLAACHATGR